MTEHDHDHKPAAGQTVALNLAVNIGLTLAKWTAFLLTGSPSLFGEAAHSTADTLNPVLLWTGYRRGRRPKCERHPGGHGRETFFWSLVAAEVMLVLGAGLTAWRGLTALLTGQTPEYSPWSLGIMVFALLAEAVTFTLAYRRLKAESRGRPAKELGRSRDTILLGILLENGVDALGVILALLGFGLFALTGQAVWDALFSLAIAAVLGTSSIFLIRRNRSLLVGETAPPEIRTAIAAALRDRDGRAEVAEITAVVRGPEEIHCRIKLRLDRERFVNGWCSGPAAKPYLAGDPVRWCLDQTAGEFAAIRSAVVAAVPEITLVDIEML